MNHLIIGRPQRRLIPLLLVGLGSLAVFSGLYLTQRAVPAQASSGYLNTLHSKYPALVGTRLDTCSFCHTSAPSLNSYGSAWRTAGGSSAAFGSIEGQDFDKDGFTNLQEINALKFPGDANDHPAAAPTATATRPPLPTNTATRPPAPTNTATKPPAPTNTPTAAPTNTPTKPPAPTNTATALPQPTKTSTLPPQPTSTATQPPQPTATQPTAPAPQPSATATMPPAPTATQPPMPTSTQPPAPPSGQEQKLNPSADASVAKGQSGQNSGSALTLQASSSPTTRSYLKFSLPRMEDKSIQKATLSLYIENGTGNGFSLYSVREGRWSEGRISYRNAPEIRRAIASGSGAAGTWVTLDVTGRLSGEGSISLAVVAKDGSSYSFGSRESGGHAPVLTIVTGTDESGGDHEDDD